MPLVGLPFVILVFPDHTHFSNQVNETDFDILLKNISIRYIAETILNTDNNFRNTYLT